jgi:hypothetical protein
MCTRGLGPVSYCRSGRTQMHSMHSHGPGQVLSARSRACAGDSSGLQSWIPHASGSTRLSRLLHGGRVQHRGMMCSAQGGMPRTTPRLCSAEEPPPYGCMCIGRRGSQHHGCTMMATSCHRGSVRPRRQCNVARMGRRRPVPRALVLVQSRGVDSYRGACACAHEKESVRAGRAWQLGPRPCGPYAASTPCIGHRNTQHCTSTPMADAPMRRHSDRGCAQHGRRPHVQLKACGTRSMHAPLMVLTLSAWAQCSSSHATSTVSRRCTAFPPAGTPACGWAPAAARGKGAPSSCLTAAGASVT